MLPAGLLQQSKHRGSITFECLEAGACDCSAVSEQPYLDKKTYAEISWLVQASPRCLARCRRAGPRELQQRRRGLRPCHTVASGLAAAWKFSSQRFARRPTHLDTAAASAALASCIASSPTSGRAFPALGSTPAVRSSGSHGSGTSLGCDAPAAKRTACSGRRRARLRRGAQCGHPESRKSLALDSKSWPRARSSRNSAPAGRRRSAVDLPPCLQSWGLVATWALPASRRRGAADHGGRTVQLGDQRLCRSVAVADRAAAAR